MPNFMGAQVLEVPAQSNRGGGSRACPADGPAPSRTIAAVGFLDHRGEAEPPGRVGAAGRAAAPRSITACSSSRRRSTAPRSRAAPSVGLRHALRVAVEPIGRPLRRGREVELVDRPRRPRRDEGLEAGVLPQLVGAAAAPTRRAAVPGRVARRRVAGSAAPAVRLSDASTSTLDAAITALACASPDDGSSAEHGDGRSALRRSAVLAVLHAPHAVPEAADVPLRPTPRLQVRLPARRSTSAATSTR